MTTKHHLEVDDIGPKAQNTGTSDVWRNHKRSYFLLAMAAGLLGPILASVAYCVYILLINGVEDSGFVEGLLLVIIYSTSTILPLSILVGFPLMLLFRFSSNLVWYVIALVVTLCIIAALHFALGPFESGALACIGLYGSVYGLVTVGLRRPFEA
jgi:hypothetical protein